MATCGEASVNNKDNGVVFHSVDNILGVHGDIGWVTFKCCLCCEEYKNDNGYRGCRWINVTHHGESVWVCYRCIRPLWKEIQRGCPSGSWEDFEYRNRSVQRDGEFWMRLKEEIYRVLAAENVPIPSDEDENEMEVLQSGFTT